MFLLGPVAQSVEQRIENPCVGGSIPPQATSYPLEDVRESPKKPRSPSERGFFLSKADHLGALTSGPRWG